MIKIAYLCEPQLGGTFTFFRRLRPALAARGIDLRCVTAWSEADFRASPFADADGVECLGLGEAEGRGAEGRGPTSEVGGNETEVGALRAATGRMIDHLVAGGYELVMILPAADYLSNALPAYLPREIRCVIRVPMMTRGAYAPTQAIAPHLNRIYAVSDRIADDLTRRYDIPRGLVDVVYHGIDAAPFTGALEAKRRGDPVQLLYAGRLWDLDKGVFLLPEIMRRLHAERRPVRLVVAGSGPDEAELRRRFERAGVMDQVDMTGGLSLDRMLEQYRAADIFIFPSRFEGFGFAVLEAMAAGCAPVVADIRGSLRTIVDEGRAGLPARVGDAADFARAIGELVGDRARLKTIQEQAWRRARETYSLERMADRYAASFRAVLAAPDHRAPPQALADYAIPNALQPTWRTWIPRPLKNFIRTWLERFGISS